MEREGKRNESKGEERVRKRQRREGHCHCQGYGEVISDSMPRGSWPPSWCTLFSNAVLSRSSTQIPFDSFTVIRITQFRLISHTLRFLFTKRTRTLF